MRPRDPDLGHGVPSAAVELDRPRRPYCPSGQGTLNLQPSLDRVCRICSRMCICISHVGIAWWWRCCVGRPGEGGGGCASRCAGVRSPLPGPALSQMMKREQMPASGPASMPRMALTTPAEVAPGGPAWSPTPLSPPSLAIRCGERGKGGGQDRDRVCIDGCCCVLAMLPQGSVALFCWRPSLMHVARRASLHRRRDAC